MCPILPYPAKPNHDMPLNPTTQTAINVGFTITCSACGKPGLVKTLSHRNAMLMKRIMPIDDRNKDSLDLLELLLCNENLNVSWLLSSIVFKQNLSRNMIPLWEEGKTFGSVQRVLPQWKVYLSKDKKGFLFKNETK